MIIETQISELPFHMTTTTHNWSESFQISHFTVYINARGQGRGTSPEVSIFLAEAQVSGWECGRDAGSEEYNKVRKSEGEGKLWDTTDEIKKS